MMRFSSNIVARVCALLLFVLVVGPARFAGAGAAHQPPDDLDLASFAGALRPEFARELERHADATRYALDMTIDPERLTVRGEQAIRYVNRDPEPLTDLVLRLYPNTAYMNGAMQLLRVAVDGRATEPVSFTRNGFPDASAVRLNLSQPLQPGAPVRIDLSYVVTAPLDSRTGYTTFGMIDGILALPNAYAMIPPRDAYGWRADIAPGFGDIVQSEIGLYRAIIRAPADFVVVASGACDQAAPQAGLAITACTAGPARDFAVHLSRFYRSLMGVLPSELGSDVAVRTFFTPLHQRAGENALLYATEALRAFERHFGAYPFKVLNVFESPSVAGGIEYPMAVGVNASKYQSDGGYFEWIVAHEVAHQWWYGLVGSDPINEAWLDEALAQYSASLYIEDRYGAAVAQAERQRFFYDRYAAEASLRGDARAAQPSGAFYRWTYAPIIYGEAPLFYEDVRRKGGDARFTLWLRRYFERHRFGIARGRDLLAVAESVGLGREAKLAYERRIMGR